MWKVLKNDNVVSAWGTYSAAVQWQNTREYPSMYVIVPDVNNILPAKPNNQWQFTVPNMEAVDFNLIARDLSYCKPLCHVVTTSRDGKTVTLYRVVHDSLDVKSCATGELPPEAVSEELFKDCSVYVLKDSSHIAEWVLWAKSVKASSWPVGNVKHAVECTVLSV